MRTIKITPNIKIDTLYPVSDKWWRSTNLRFFDVLEINNLQHNICNHMSRINLKEGSYSWYEINLKITKEKNKNKPSYTTKYIFTPNYEKSPSSNTAPIRVLDFLYLIKRLYKIIDVEDIYIHDGKSNIRLCNFYNELTISIDHY